ncbi:MAG: PD-(D/E)XK nuclease family protein [Oscillospiraceae bacterium]|nr:PD-(D/E)XK nuclease family protein [Oscillospiraceae bacterium]
MSELRIVTGRGGSGKTAYILNEIRERMEAGETGLILLVPDQFSHEAERLLCEACGDRVSLHAEVLSFPRLFYRLVSDMGGISQEYIDRAGKLLVMRRAVALADSMNGSEHAYSRLTDRILSLLETASDCTSSQIRPERLYALSDRTEGLLRDKLRYLASVLEIYNGLLHQDLHDPDEMLDKLCELIPHSEKVWNARVWVDGFRDFSVQQYSVLGQLLAFARSFTVSLTLDTEAEDDLVFHTAALTRRRLTGIAVRAGASVDLITCRRDKSVRSPEMEHLEHHCFSDKPAAFGPTDRIRLWTCRRDRDEFEACASSILDCVRAGARFRDIAVAVGNIWEKESLFRAVMEEYGIPVYINSKKDIMRYPPTAVLLSSLNVLLRNWESEAVFSYLKSGYSGITEDECDLLENYAYTWSIQGKKWTSDKPWTMPPGGFSESAPDETLLATLNDIRRRVCDPLMRLDRDMRAAGSAGDMIRTLFRFADEIGLYEKTEELSDRLRQGGDEHTADEFLSACEILTVAAEQFLLTAGDSACELQEFAQLWTALLEQYDFGFIPDTTDRVCAGDISRIRRRGIRHLYILGASDDVLPSLPSERGIFSEEERELLSRIDSVFSPPVDERLAIGQADAYDLLTQSADRLTLSFSEESGSVPSRYFTVLKNMFSLDPQTPERTRCRLSAPEPSFDLALTGPDDDPYTLAARQFWHSDLRYEEMRELADAARHPQERMISEDSAHKLYGKTAVLSATRLEQYSNCPFSYFLTYGMKLVPRTQAELSPLLFGSLYHKVMENTSSEIMREGGFHSVPAADCLRIAERNMEECLSSVSSVGDENARLRFLIRKTSEDILSAVQDLSDELSSSLFVPLAFEMDFSPHGTLPPYEIRSEKGTVCVHGKIDRVDGWENDGKLYLRIVDYKTGSTSFRLSDVLYGRNMQMLIYLFALKKFGPSFFGREIVPAGILYASPVKEYVDVSPDISNEVLEKKLLSGRRHTGLIMADRSVFSAMDSNDPPVYLPEVTKKDGTPEPGTTFTIQQEDLLNRFVDRRIGDCCNGILSGNIRSMRRAIPGKDPCQWCDFRSICSPDRQPVAVQPVLRGEDCWKQIEGGGEL